MIFPRIFADAPVEFAGRDVQKVTAIAFSISVWRIVSMRACRNCSAVAKSSDLFLHLPDPLPVRYFLIFDRPSRQVRQVF